MLRWHDGRLESFSASDPGIMNPVAEVAWLQIQRMCFNGLIDYDEQANIVPGLATSWEVPPNGMTYTLHLHPNVKWHDGKALTSEDVKFTYEKILDPKMGSRFNLYFQPVIDIQTPDATTFVVTLNRPDPLFFAQLWVGIMPKHIWEREDFATSQYNVSPVGSGPWKLKEWARQDHMLFEANPDYFLGRPYLDRIILKVIPEPAVAFAAVEKGDVDYFPFSGVIGGPPYQLVNRLKQSPNVEVRIFEGSFTQRMYFRTDKPPFNDLRVRQAVAHAIDKRFIIEKLLFGYGQITHSEVPAVLKWAHTPDLTKYDHDLNKANKLLDEAGYPKGAGGVRLKTHIYGTPGVRTILSQILREQFKAVGIASEVVINEWTTYYRGIRETRDVDGVFTIFSLPSVPDPGDETVNYLSSEIKPGGLNFMFYNNPRVDALIKESQMTLDRDKRAQIFSEYQEILARDLPMILLYTLTGVDSWNKKFTGFGVGQWGASPFQWLEKVWKQE